MTRFPARTTRCREAAHVDAVVRVGGVAEDALVLLVEPVHRPPGRSGLALQDRGMGGERDVLPGAPGRVPVAAHDLEPHGLAQVGVHAAVVCRPQRAIGEVLDREVGDRVAARLEEQDGVVALHHGLSTELGAHVPPQWLGVQDALRHPGDQELPGGIAAERPLLP
jgi:hypothetical protein